MNAFIRPAWTPVTIALMIIGFMVFWPLGLAMIAYIIWGDRLEQFKTDVNAATDRASNMFQRGNYRMGGMTSRTGNVAFDDWREAELKRLHEQRLELDSMRAQFDDYSRELRRAKDEEEFKLFMANRKDTVENDAPKAVKSTKSKKTSAKPATA